jgi:hypothetical protein
MIFRGSSVYWIGGAGVSALGVLLVRCVPGWTAGASPVLIRLAGYGLSFAGLLLILHGLRKKGNRLQ